MKKYAPQITQIFADLIEKKICGNLWKSVVKKICTTDYADSHRLKSSEKKSVKICGNPW
jgi:hypothetical protein